MEQAAWTAQARAYLFAQANLSKGARLLEVGCGTGAVMSSIPASFNQPAHGLDIDFEYLQIAHGLLPAARLVCGDAHWLPYNSGAFDACFCHFFLMWVNAANVLIEMRRVTQPGGWILALAEPDYGGRIDYPEQLGQIGRWQAQALRKQGADPNTGRRLTSLFTETGLVDIRAGVIGGEWTGALSQEELDSEWQVIHDDLKESVNKQELDRLKDLDEEARCRGTRVLYVPVFYAAGRVPPV